MNNKYCNGNCFDDFLDDYDEDSDNYKIQRLKDIIKICEFLIECEENKKSRKVLDEILDSAMEKGKEEKKDHDTAVVHSPKRNKYWIYPYYVPVKPYRNDRIPWWEQVWF